MNGNGYIKRWWYEMKAIINGVEVECSVEEFKELVDINVQPTELAPVHNDYIPRKKYPRTTISKEQIQKYKEIVNEIRNSSPKILSEIIKEKFNTTNPTVHYRHIKKMLTPEEYNTIINKHQKERFLNAHKIKREQGITLQQALKIVDGKSTIENEHSQYMIQHRPKPIIDGTTQQIKLANKSVTLSEFPRIYPIHEESIPLLKDMIKQMIADKSELSFFSVRNTLRLANNEEWNGHKWREFVQQVLMNKKKIAEYFLSNPHKLKIIVRDGFHYLTYEK